MFEKTTRKELIRFIEEARSERDAHITEVRYAYNEMGVARDEAMRLREQLAAAKADGEGAFALAQERLNRALKAEADLAAAKAREDALRLQNDTYANLADGLRQDAMRYRWLREEIEWMPPHYNGVKASRFSWWQESEIKCLDDFIDAAIAGSKT